MEGFVKVHVANLPQNGPHAGNDLIFDLHQDVKHLSLIYTSVQLVLTDSRNGFNEGPTGWYAIHRWLFDSFVSHMVSRTTGKLALSGERVTDPKQLDLFECRTLPEEVK